MKFIKKFEKFSKSEYTNLVNKTIKSGIGGKEFFNKIDKYIKEDPDIIGEICSGLDNDWVVSSGAFGDGVYQLWESGKIKCKGVVVFNGKILTKNKGVNSYYSENFDLDNKEFVFVDDSIFSGKTIGAIEDYLKEEHNSNFKSIDGATCDHREPISKGGDRYNYINLAVCCYRCNMEKSDIGYSEWLDMIKSI